VSVALHPGCDRRQAGVIPLAAGLALARALDGLGVAADLKWPNDLLLGGRKLAGILAEWRRLPGAGGGEEAEVVVIGVGVNVGERTGDFPAELRERSTSLAIAGCDAAREDVAAAFLGALEPLWTQVAEGGRAAVLDAWRARAGFWGRAVVARTPAGTVRGIAHGLDADGALRLRRDDGTLATVHAGDVELGAGDGG